ncbi:MAG: hypothetical protein ACI8QC_002059 [Planctomycetota bacterium]|jgi:uncharacterized protein
MNMPGLKQKLTDAELKEVHTVLNQGTEGLESGELDGFLTAICTAPGTLDPDLWLAIVFGDFEFQSEADSTRFIGLILRRYNEVVEHLAKEGAAWPSASMDDDEAAEWCSGYMQGVREDPSWMEDDEAVAYSISIAVLAGEFDLVGEEDADGNIIEDVTPHLIQYRTELPEIVRLLDDYWEEARELEANKSMPAISTKQDRNAPCPCGSGRKHKKCCGK